MNCRDIDGMLVEGSLGSAFSTDVEDHVGDCERCRLLMSATRTSALTDEPSSVTLHHIEARVIADLRPVRPLNRLYVLAALIGIFVLAVAVAVYRLGAFAIKVMSPLQASVMLGTLALCTGLLVSSLVQQIVPGRRHRIAPHLAPAGIMVALAGVIALLFHFQPERNFWARDWACLKAGMSMGAIVAVPLWLVLRRGAILSPALTGAAAGLLAGLVGTSSLELHCPNLHAAHILVSHLGVAVLGAAAGLFTGIVVEVRNSCATPSSIPRERRRV